MKAKKIKIKKTINDIAHDAISEMTEIIDNMRKDDHVNNINDQYSYKVTLSSDNEYIAICAEFPSLSWVDKSKNLALNGIHKLVSDVVKDLKRQKEPVPIPLKKRFD